MALPTVEYARIAAAAGSSLHASVMPVLCGLLDDAGWTQEFIDSDAIGGGSSGSPAWDKSPANNTQCGRAVYSMPANGHSRAWFVEFLPAWGGTAANNIIWRYRVGTGIDGSDNLIDPGDYLAVSTNSAQAGHLETLLATSEDGFALVSTTNVAGATNRMLVLERARSLAGAVLDDLVVYGAAGVSVNAEWPDSVSVLTGGGACVRYRASDGFQYTGRLGMYLPNVTTVSISGQTNVPIGPIPMSGEMAGYPRLALRVSTSDSVVSTDHPVHVDGQVRIYRTNTLSSADNVGGYGSSFLVAME